MCVAIYFFLKILFLAGLVFSVVGIFNPDLMTKFIIALSRWKLKLFGLEADLRPLPNIRSVMRVWSVVMAVIFGVLVYVLTSVIMLAYQMK